MNDNIFFFTLPHTLSNTHIYSRCNVFEKWFEDDQTYNNLNKKKKYFVFSSQLTPRLFFYKSNGYPCLSIEPAEASVLKSTISIQEKLATCVSFRSPTSNELFQCRARYLCEIYKVVHSGILNDIRGVMRSLSRVTSHGFNLTALRSWIDELVRLLFGLTDRNCVKALQEKRKKDTRDTKARISRRVYIYTYIEGKKTKRILREFLTLPESKCSYVDGNTRFFLSLRLMLSVSIFWLFLLAVVYRSYCILDHTYAFNCLRMDKD